MTQSTRTRASLSISMVVAMLAAALWWTVSRDQGGTSMPNSAAPADVSTADLATASTARVFFGHQSVGMNVLDGLPALYADHAMPAPRIEQGRRPLSAPGGFVEHDYLGVNEQPLGKIQDFDHALRSGLAEHVDVAIMKLCYIDFRSDTDVDALFAAYRDTIEALERDFPDITIVKATVPLMTDRRGLSKLKARISGNDRFGPAENVARERFNTLVRERYAGDHLFDVAAAESTAPDGARSGGRHDGQDYFALYDGYASDPGHLNAQGAKMAAAAWVRAVAGAVR